MGEPLRKNQQHLNYSVKQLIDGLKSQNDDERQLFQTLFFKKYVQYLFKAAIQKCKNFNDPEALANDLVQECFIRVFKIVQKFNFPANAPESDHSYIIKAWLGKIANNCFRQVYAKHLDERKIEIHAKQIEEILCPICADVLVEEKKNLVCRNKHYKVKLEKFKIAQPLTETGDQYDLFKMMYEKSDVEVTSDNMNKLLAAMSTLTEKQRHILIAYANEGCLDSKRHISDSALKELCALYNDSPDNIKHIKNRAFSKITTICFS